MDDLLQFLGTRVPGHGRGTVLQIEPPEDGPVFDLFDAPWAAEGMFDPWAGAVGVTPQSPNDTAPELSLAMPSLVDGDAAVPFSATSGSAIPPLAKMTAFPETDPVSASPGAGVPPDLAAARGDALAPTAPRPQPQAAPPARGVPIAFQATATGVLADEAAALTSVGGNLASVPLAVETGTVLAGPGATGLAVANATQDASGAIGRGQSPAPAGRPPREGAQSADALRTQDPAKPAFSGPGPLPASSQAVKGAASVYLPTDGAASTPRPLLQPAQAMPDAKHAAAMPTQPSGTGPQAAGVIHLPAAASRSGDPAAPPGDATRTGHSPGTEKAPPPLSGLSQAKAAGPLEAGAAARNELAPAEQARVLSAGPTARSEAVPAQAPIAARPSEAAPSATRVSAPGHTAPGAPERDATIRPPDPGIRSPGASTSDGSGLRIQPATVQSSIPSPDAKSMGQREADADPNPTRVAAGTEKTDRSEFRTDRAPAIDAARPGSPPDNRSATTPAPSIPTFTAAAKTSRSEQVAQPRVNAESTPARAAPGHEPARAAPGPAATVAANPLPAAMGESTSDGPHRLAVLAPSAPDASSQIGTMAPAPATATPIAPLANPASHPAASIAHQLATALQQHAPEPGAPIDIALDPPELGRLRLSVTEVNGAMTLSITADRPETADLMRRHLSLLGQEFQRAGVDAPSVQISHGETGQRHSGQPDHGAAPHDGPPDDQPGQAAPVTSKKPRPDADGALDLRL